MLLRDIFPKLTHNNFLDRTHKNVSDVSFKWILRDRFTVFEVIILIYDLCRVGVFFPEFQPQQFCLSLLTSILHSFKNILSLDHVSAWTPFPPPSPTPPPPPPHPPPKNERFRAKKLTQFGQK